MSRGPRGRKLDSKFVSVALDGSGYGATAVSFSETFLRAPAVLVVPDEADAAAGATYLADNIVYGGFNLKITGSKLTNVTVEVLYLAAEKG